MRKISIGRILIFITSVILISIFSVLYYLSNTVLYHTSKIPKSNSILIFAHKGLHDTAQENTIQAFKDAEQNNFDGIDIDLQKTKDEKIIIYHNKEDKKSHKQITDENYSQLNEFTVKNKETTPNNIPTFQETLNNTSRVITAEMKDENFESNVISLLSNESDKRRVYISSFNPVSLYKIKLIAPETKIMFDFGRASFNSQNVSKNKYNDILKKILPHKNYVILVINILQPDFLSINHKEDKNLILELENKNYPVFIWTPSSKQNILKAADLNPYAIITNNPKLVREMLKNTN